MANLSAPSQSTSAPTLTENAELKDFSLPDDKETSTPKFMIFGFHPAFWGEMVLFLGLALALDHFYLAGDRLWDVAPHPFWFIVLLITFQYGTGEGLLTAFFSSAALLAWNIPVQTIQQDLFEHLFSTYFLPLLWFASATIFGAIRDRHRKKQRELEYQLSYAQRQADVFSTAYRRLDKARGRLEETHVSSQSSSILSLHQASMNMEALEPDQVLSNILEITLTVMKADKASWFGLSEHRLEATAQSGWETEDNYSRFFNSDTPLFKEIVEDKRVVCITDPDDEKILNGEGMIAGPLINTETGVVYGMLKLEELDFLDLNLSTVQSFKAVCEWMGTLLGTSTRYQEGLAQRIQNPESLLLSKLYYERLSEFLIHLSDRIGFDVFTLMLRPSNQILKNPALRKRIEKILNEKIVPIFRKTDLVFEGQEINCEYAMLLPNTNSEQAKIVSTKLQRILTSELAVIDLSSDDFTISMDPLRGKGEKRPAVS